MSRVYSASITLRTTDEEKAKIHSHAAASGLSISEFGRIVLMETIYPGPFRPNLTNILASIQALSVSMRTVFESSSSRPEEVSKIWARNELLSSELANSFLATASRAGK